MHLYITNEDSDPDSVDYNVLDNKSAICARCQKFSRLINFTEYI